MPPRELVDTGALVAIVNTHDQWHIVCRAALREVSLPLMTTTAVFTEAFYFASKGRGVVERVWEFVRSGGVTIAQISDTDLPALETLMHRYADRPMDFADATLVHVAEREGLRTVFTVDHSDFETYRIGRNAKFRVIPPRAK